MSTVSEKLTGTTCTRSLLRVACVIVVTLDLFLDGFSSKSALLDSVHRLTTTVEFKPQHAATSHVALVNGSVIKTPKTFLNYKTLDREICVLSRLQQFPAFPRLLNFTSSTLTTSFVGKEVTADTLPDNYREQFQKILADMASVNVKHNDIMFPCSKAPRKWEVMVLDGRLSLIDFGWATVGNAVPCSASTQKFVPGWRPCPDAKALEVMDGMARVKAARDKVHGTNQTGTMSKAARDKVTAAAAGANVTRGTNQTGAMSKAVRENVTATGPGATATRGTNQTSVIFKAMRENVTATTTGTNATRGTKLTGTMPKAARENVNAAAAGINATRGTNLTNAMSKAPKENVTAVAAGANATRGTNLTGVMSAASNF